MSSNEREWGQTNTETVGNQHNQVSTNEQQDKRKRARICGQRGPNKHEQASSRDQHERTWVSTCAEGRHTCKTKRVQMNGRTQANKQVVGTSMNRQEPAQPSRDQVAGPSTSEHTTEQVQTRWYKHEQGQERGEQRQAWGWVSEGNAAASSSENSSGYNKCSSSNNNGSSRSGQDQEQEWEQEHQQLQGWHLQQEQGYYVPPPLLFFFFFFL